MTCDNDACHNFNYTKLHTSGFVRDGVSNLTDLLPNTSFTESEPAVKCTVSVYLQKTTCIENPLMEALREQMLDLTKAHILQHYKLAQGEFYIHCHEM